MTITLSDREVNTVLRLLKDERRILTDRVKEKGNVWDKADLVEVNRIIDELDRN